MAAIVAVSGIAALGIATGFRHVPKVPALASASVVAAPPVAPSPGPGETAVQMAARDVATLAPAQDASAPAVPVGTTASIAAPVGLTGVPPVDTAPSPPAAEASVMPPRLAPSPEPEPSARLAASPIVAPAPGLITAEIARPEEAAEPAAAAGAPLAARAPPTPPPRPPDRRRQAAETVAASVRRTRSPVLAAPRAPATAFSAALEARGTGSIQAPRRPAKPRPAPPATRDPDEPAPANWLMPAQLGPTQ